MGDSQHGARWRQIRSEALTTPEGQDNYQAGYRQAQSYRDTMHVVDGLRKALGVSQSELARRLAKKQPTVARLLTQGENPTLETLAEVLASLGLHARIVIERGDVAHPEEALTVEVEPAKSA